MARSDPTAFVVTVLEGPRSGLKIPLQERSLPFRSSAGGSISFGVEATTKEVWYPGNPVATQLVFGARIPPTTINGTWSDRYLGEDRAIDLVDLFMELVETCVQVRVMWSALEYQGVIKTFVMTPGVPTGGLGDLGWTMTFAWNSSKGRRARRVVGADRPIRDDVAAGANAFAAFRQTLEDFVRTVNDLHGLGSTLAAGFEARVGDLLAEGLPALETLIQVPASLGLVTEPPPRLLGSAVTAHGRGLDNIGEALELVAGTFAGALSTDASIEAVLAKHLGRVDVLDSGFQALEVLWLGLRRLEALTRPAARVLVRPVRGSDLREYALLYYGQPDLWGRLAAVNGIDEGSRIPDDVDELLIPLELTGAVDQLLQADDQETTRTGA